MGAAGWAVVIPVKRLAWAKTRLRGVLDAERHQSLALALARDTLTAVRGCPDVAEIQVVTDDPRVADTALALGAAVASDPPGADRKRDAGLNAAIERDPGLNAAIERDPGLNAAIERGAGLVAHQGRWLAALTADLPALRPTELSAALRAARRRPARRFVPDAAGTGTVLLTAPPGATLGPCFGADSAAAHAASGAVPLDGDWWSLRRDVDTVDDLRAAAALGLGGHTRRLLVLAGGADLPAIGV